MKVHRWADIPAEVLNEGLTRQAVHTDMMTVARLALRKGAVVPRHSHPNEQISTIESGRLRFIFDDGVIEASTGESVEIPGNVAHAVHALEDSVALDLFAPRREDWLRGDDAYLRAGR
jgi:quercetin dioxygenase-like cupin family protein